MSEFADDWITTGWSRGPADLGYLPPRKTSSKQLPSWPRTARKRRNRWHSKFEKCTAR